MNTQRKTIESFRSASTSLNLFMQVLRHDFEDSSAVNIHGLHATLGVAPLGPDETLQGRWYILALPNSITQDSDILLEWLSNLNVNTTANLQLSSTEFVWGSGSFIASDATPLNIDFAPKTSRNMMKGSSLQMIVVADQIDGAIDDWFGIGSFSFFTTS